MGQQTEEMTLIDMLEADFGERYRPEFEKMADDAAVFVTEIPVAWQVSQAPLLAALARRAGGDNSLHTLVTIANAVSDVVVMFNGADSRPKAADPAWISAHLNIWEDLGDLTTPVEQEPRRWRTT